MDKSRLLGKMASKLHAHYSKQSKGTAPAWRELSKEEKRVWTGLARLASNILGTERFAPLSKPAGQAPSGKVKKDRSLQAEGPKEPTGETKVLTSQAEGSKEPTDERKVPTSQAEGSKEPTGETKVPTSQAEGSKEPTGETKVSTSAE